MIPSPLLDRMEIIAIAGYITDEKMHIARDYLEKNTRDASGIKPEQVNNAFIDFIGKNVLA
jgi:ATP-dependent Lon protease